MAFFDEILAQIGKSAGAPQAPPGGTVGSMRSGQSPIAVALQELLKNCNCDGAASADGANQSMPRRGPSAPAASGETGQGDDLAAGLNNLIKRLQDGGLDQVIKTWIGTGQNAPVEPRDLGAALGRDSIRKARTSPASQRTTC